MQADERIEDEQARLQPGDGVVEAGAVGVEMEARLGAVITWNVEFGESGAGSGTDAFEEAATHDVQIVSPRA